MQKIPELSVFFPAYNEEENIKNTVLKAVSVCQQVTDKYEIIVVNDGSKDNTPVIVEELIKSNPNIVMLSHSPNQGYGGALKTGMYACKYKYVAFNDSDGQFDFSQIERFIPYLNDYPVVIGYRTTRVEGFRRALNAKAWGMLVDFLFNIHVKDIDCAFKVFEKAVLDKIPKLESNGALISTEFLVKVRRANIKIKEVPVDHYPRKAGKPTGANFKVIIKAFTELLRLWNKLR